MVSCGQMYFADFAFAVLKPEALLQAVHINDER
jgi:hypothetical protein